MKVTILGCHGGVAPGYRTSCYMINDEFLIDAGSVASALTPKEQHTITDIFITHSHIDHIKDICFLIENTFSTDRDVLHLRSTPIILSHIHNHMLNDILWPDFSKIYIDQKKEKALLDFIPLQSDFKFGHITISHYSVNHVGPAIGYILDDGEKQVVFTGDTGPTEEIWAQASRCSNLVGVFTEISFPNHREELAKASGHFTLKQLMQDLKKLRQSNVPIYIAHFKPLFFEELMDEFHKLAPKNMKLLHQQDEINF